MYLQSAEIQNFRGIRHLAINFERDTTVLIGENAWGKSSLLYALFMILGQGDQHLCALSRDDLYIPIRLARDPSPSAAAPAAATTATAAATPADSAAPAPTPAPTATTAAARDDARATTTLPEAASAQSASVADAEEQPTPEYDLSYLISQNLSALTPLKVVAYPDFERRLFQLPNPFGAGTIFRIVDVPRTGRNPRDRRGLIDCYFETRPSELGTPHIEVVPSTELRAEDSAPRLQNFALERFVRPGPAPHSAEPGAMSTPRTKLSALARALYGDFAELHEGMLSEAQYEQNRPLSYQPTTTERMARTKQRLEPDSGLNQEARAQAQKDLDFACHDVFSAHCEQIVIDLIFCENTFGALNNLERLAPLKAAAYLGADDLYRIHYRIQAQYCAEQDEGCAPDGAIKLKEQDFITTHELLDAKGRPLPHPLPIIRELIVLNPLLRLRDRRMLSGHWSSALQHHAAAVPPRAPQPTLDGAAASATAPQGAFTKLGQAATHLMMGTGPGTGLSGAASATHHATSSAQSSVGSSGAPQLEPSDMQAITHLFADISSEDELTAHKINQGLAVLNTLASKYLSNYQATNLGAVIKEQVSSATAPRPASRSVPGTPDRGAPLSGATAAPAAADAAPRPVRTAREIVATPISVGSLSSLKDALSDSKPSSSKLLLSLLAGALMMSQGQRTIDTYSRPILVLEDIESRFHPTLLLNLWSILQTLPIQKIVTTNSAQFASAISLHKLRRLCKQYYDVRCYQIADKVFSNDEERKIAFHVRMIRPSALFARCWLLVEGETEVWILNEIANILGLNLACNGVHLIEFAQCGLHPLIKLAQQLGISYHVLTDGDEAGRHYAQTVREFTGGAELADHLSVMPHVDIEHYLYTSGFANVYQRAANLELKPKRGNAAQLGISNKNLRAKVNELIHNPNLKIYYLEIDQVPYYTAPGYDPKHHQKANQLTMNVDLGTKPSAEPLSKTANQEQTKAPNKAQNKAQSAPQSAPAPTQPKVPASHHKAQHLPPGQRSTKLVHHQLAAVIKTMMTHGITKYCPSFNKIFNRSKLQRKVAQAAPFKLEALSEADVNSFYSYLRTLVMTMPHPNRGLTAKQSSYLQELKALRTKLLAQVNSNRQRLKSQMQKQQAKERARKLQAQAAAHPGKAVATNQLTAPSPQEQAEAAGQAVLVAHFDWISSSQGTVLGQADPQPMSESQALLAHLTELASENQLDAKEQNRLRLLERDQGNSINERYGALNEAALTHKGLSVNKVIEEAIHRKTKPGLAILVGEAIQQRGPDSVPVLFRTMFRKIQRMAQSEYALD